MAELGAGIRFDGLGATAGGATDAARILAEHLNHWTADHPTSRILDLAIQSVTIGAELHLTAIISYVEEPAIEESAAVAIAEEIVRASSEDTE